jgi:hypothetical protein
MNPLLNVNSLPASVAVNALLRGEALHALLLDELARKFSAQCINISGLRFCIFVCGSSLGRGWVCDWVTRGLCKGLEVSIRAYSGY